MRKPYVSPGHVIWAYDVHIYDWHDQGLSPAQIRLKLREWNIHVGIEAIKAVLAARSRLHP